ncbi:MAG: hypothetical protein JWL86_3196 [Rhizobium sp.]|nr:hypothetical protein [Rhizobium sp.]
MTNELSEHSADELLRMIDDEIDRGEDFSYKATWNLIGRWRRGGELEPLIKLLQSKESRDRSVGTWYVRELGGPVEGLTDAVIGLADDGLHVCRWTVPYFIINSGFYDETIAMKLAKLLVDHHLVVRTEVIKWAVYTVDEEFEDFSGLIESGASASTHKWHDPTLEEFWKASEGKRALRGLEIARRLRNWEAAEDIRLDIPEEDSFVFDGLHFSRGNIKRHLERRRIEAQGRTT